MSFTVGQVAGFAGVTVRTLHHYDEIGLLSPGDRSAAGYRRYSASDLERLQQILFYRELGFALEEIVTILDEPLDAAEHLRRQHRILTERIGRMQAMRKAVERALEAKRMGINLTPQEQFEIFGDWLGEGYAAEAEQRWGETEAYRDSMRTAASMKKEDWVRMKAEADDLERRFAAALAAGRAADSVAAMDLAEEHRAQISRLSPNIDSKLHRHIVDLYVTDERFAARYDAVAPGLGAYIRDAAHANADRAGV